MNQLNYLNTSFKKLDDSWQQFLIEKLKQELYSIDNMLVKMAENTTIFPPNNLIFEALTKTKLHDVSVVIIGQDPYHGINEANGLAFAVNNDIKLPPSLKNILKELKQEYPNSPTEPNNQSLLTWAKQGVLLLNSTLTVIQDKPNSLANIGWDLITNQIIKKISDSHINNVFILWGAFATQKSIFIDQNKHLILKAPHPSPLSAYRGFFGCNHFIQTNEYLTAHHKTPITWF